MNVIVISSEGNVSAQSIDPDAILEELEDIVDGDTEHLRSVKIREGYAVISNKEPDLDDLPVNTQASQLIGYMVFGTIVIVREGEEGYESVATDVTPTTYQSLCFMSYCDLLCTLL